MLVRRKLIANKARSLLEKWNCQNIPVDVYALAKNEGIQVREDDAGDETLSGFLLVDGDVKIIGVNKSHHERRRRFTVSHELGHYSLHSVGNGTAHVDKSENIGVHFRDSTSSAGTEVEEMEANLFAAELLMPEELLRVKLGELAGRASLSSDETIDELAKDFNVSVQAMTIRLSSLGFVKM